MSKFDPIKSEGNIKAGGYYYQGVSTLGEYKGDQFVLIAPDMPSLKAIWDMIMTIQFNSHNCMKVIATSPKNLEAISVPSINEMLNKKEEFRDINYYWYLHPESNCAFVEFANFVSHDGMSEQLGIAEKLTEIECKLLLRRLGWKREDIEKLDIHEGDPIPF